MRELFVPASVVCIYWLVFITRTNRNARSGAAVRPRCLLLLFFLAFLIFQLRRTSFPGPSSRSLDGFTAEHTDSDVGVQHGATASRGRSSSGGGGGSTGNRRDKEGRVRGRGAACTAGERERERPENIQKDMKRGRARELPVLLARMLMRGARLP